MNDRTFGINDFADGATALVSRHRRSIVAIAASAIVHVGAIALIVAIPSLTPRPHSFYVLAYLVDNGAGGGAMGRAMNGPVGAASQHPHLPRERIARRPLPRRSGRGGGVAEARADSSSARADLSPDASPISGEGSSIGGVAHAGSPFPSLGKGVRGLGPDGAGGAGAEGGGPGPGTADAHALYGESPPPAYPEHARRENQQGTVLLHVLVQANGSVARVEVAQSSGFEVLDRAAADTVRTRWRFVPAERGGERVASWVLVPIRFALRDA